MKKITLISLLLIGSVLVFMVFIRQPGTTFSEEIENKEDIDRIGILEHVDISSNEDEDENFSRTEIIRDNEKVEEFLSMLDTIDLSENRGVFSQDVDYSDRRYHVVFYDENDTQMYNLITYGDQIEITAPNMQSFYLAENQNSYI